LDLSLPDGTAFDLLDELDADAQRRIALMARDDSGETAARAGRLPLMAFLVKPFCLERFDTLLSHASAAQPLCGGLLGRCEAMRLVAAHI
ncbi:hypothetical protein OFC55_33595, partial [Escherichia coli]|nr:hypothetical protein [Escherichia coli]